MNRLLDRTIKAGFAVALLVLGVMGVVAHQTVQQWSEADLDGDASLKVLTSTNKLSITLEDVLTSARVYLTTHDPQAQKECLGLIAKVPVIVGRLHRLIDTDAIQQHNLNQLESLIRARLRVIGAMVSPASEGGTFPAIQAISVKEDESQLHTILNGLDKMQKQEVLRLEERTLAVEHSEQFATAVVTGGSLLGVLVVALSGWLVKREISALRRSEAALRESEQRFRLMADALPQSVWTANPNGEIKYCNAHFCAYSGVTFEQVKGNGWQKLVHPDDRQGTLELVARSIRTGEPFECEHRILRASDGAYRMHLVRAVPQYDVDGRIVEWIGTSTDIEDQRRQRELETARQAAENSNRFKSQFLANMSHEIRTPLSAVLGYADLLLDPAQNERQRCETVNVIRRNGELLLALISDILDLSKIEAGEMKVERVECSPWQIVSDVASSMRVRAWEKSLTFETRVDGPIPRTIRTDPMRLRQILINLVGNAVKFTESGWVRVVVKLADPADHPNPHLRFEVIDSGIGLSAEEISKIFKPFVQGDSSTTRRFGGTGLGLAISQQLARALGGEITVDSMPGRGSLFAVTIETGSLEGVELASWCKEVMVSGQETDSAGSAPVPGRILLAEDGTDNQALLCHYLRKAGAEVVTADNGRIACEKALSGQGDQFDVILMDMQMPELDGYGATAKLRQAGYQGPIIALTAHAMAGDRRKCLEAGCTDYLSKPVSRRALLGMVGRYVAAARAPLTKAVEAPVGGATAAAADDPDASQSEVMQQYVSRFVGHLPRQVNLLLASLEKENMEELGRVLHQLKGTGGMYGLMHLSEAAGHAQQVIHEQASLEQITAEVQSLVELIRGVKDYEPERERQEAANPSSA